MLAGAGGFHRRVQRKQVRLAGDFLNDRDLLGDGLHGRDSLIDGFAGDFGVLGRLAGDLLGLGGVVGVLLDVGGHLLHRGGRLFGGGGLFGRALRHLFGRGPTAAGCPRRTLSDADSESATTPRQAVHHAFERQAQHIPIRERLRLDGQVAIGDLVGDAGGLAQVAHHAAHGRDRACRRPTEA